MDCMLVKHTLEWPAGAAFRLEVVSSIGQVHYIYKMKAYTATTESVVLLNCHVSGTSSLRIGLLDDGTWHFEVGQRCIIDVWEHCQGRYGQIVYVR